MRRCEGLGTFRGPGGNNEKAGSKFYRSLHDRVSAYNQISPLADLVSKRARELNLGWSFPTTPNY